MEPKIDYYGYLRLVNKALYEHPEWRYGQTLFNVLWQYRPDLCNMAKEAGVDPFYADHHHESMRRFIIDSFLKLVHQNW